MRTDAIVHARRSCNQIMAILRALGSAPEFSKLTSLLLGVFQDLQKTIREVEGQRVH